MLIEMPFDLSLGLGDKSEAGTVAEQCGAGTNEKGARVPEWIEQARPRGELGEAALAPGEMVGFRARRGQQHFPSRLGAGDECLPVVQRLRRELTGVIDAHERSARTTVGLGQWLNGLGVLMGDGSAGPGRRENRTQSAVKGGNARVEKTA